MKSQVEYLEGELKAMAMAQNRQIGQQAEGERRENMLHMERKMYRECCAKMAEMYRQVLTIIGDGATNEVDIMNRFVELTTEKVKLIKARQLLVTKSEDTSEDVSLITNIDIQSINYKLE